VRELKYVKARSSLNAPHDIAIITAKPEAAITSARALRTCKRLTRCVNEWLREEVIDNGQDSAAGPPDRGTA
jgi:hypothetical protein